MASEREEALQSVVTEKPNPSSAPENMQQALTEAQLAHDHAIRMKRTELGWFGVLLGNEAQAPMVIAFIVVILGFMGAIGLWVVAWREGRPEFWASEAHVCLAAATSALGYVFGRGSRVDSR